MFGSYANAEVVILLPEKTPACIVICLAVFLGGTLTFFRAQKCKHMLSISGFMRNFTNK